MDCLRRTATLPFAALYILLYTTFISSCHAENDQQENILLRNASVDSVKLMLVTVKNECALQVEGEAKPIILSIPAPCGFVRADEKMKAQSFKYNDVGSVLIVAGPPAENSAYTKDSGVEPGYLCSNYGRAIIVGAKQITLRDIQNIPLAFCHRLGFDEKVFYGYAYPVD